MIGGATGRIGDPSGKSIERPELDVQTVERNSVGIENIIRGILGRWGKEMNADVGSQKDVKLDLGSSKGSVDGVSNPFIHLRLCHWVLL